MRRNEALAAAAILAAVATGCRAEVTVRDAWIRATAPGQQSAAAYATLTSSEDARVVAVATPLAGQAQVHATMMMSGIAHMHEVESLELPARKPVALAPGGTHVMLMQLRQPFRAGERVPLAFTIEDAKGRRSRVDVTATVRPLAP